MIATMGQVDALEPGMPDAVASAHESAASDLAFEAVYDTHVRDVQRYVLALTRDPDEADEVVAEAFERAYRTWRSGPRPDGHVLPWLLLTARRIAIDRWRRARRALRLTATTRRPVSAAGAGEARTEFWLWFDAVSRALSDRQREVLILRYRGDLSDEEIAAVMGLTPSGVRSLVARALAALRAHPELLR